MKINILYICIKILLLQSLISIASSNYIVVGSHGGLCNRLRVLTTYMYISKRLYNSSRIYFVWDVNRECPGHFLEVFQPLHNVTFITMKDYPIFASNAIFSRSPYETSYKNSYEILLYHNITQYTYSEINDIRRPYYDLLHPVYTIQQHINTFLYHHTCQYNMSAVHVRHTDLELLLISWHDKPSTDEEFFAFIDERILQHDKIFLMTDNRDTQSLYFKKYRDNITVFDYVAPTEACLHYGMRCTSLAQTVTELFIAAHGRAFMGSRMSSVSDMIRILRHNTLPQINCSQTIAGISAFFSYTVEVIPSTPDDLSTPDGPDGLSTPEAPSPTLHPTAPRDNPHHIRKVKNSTEMRAMFRKRVGHHDHHNNANIVA
jgi:hypothetical protein